MEEGEEGLYLFFKNKKAGGIFLSKSAKILQKFEKNQQKEKPRGADEKEDGECNGHGDESCLLVAVLFVPQAT